MEQNRKKYLIALDMDGTLLNSDHKLCPQTKNYLRSLASEGHKIIISSGRPLRGIFSVYRELGLSTPAICYNGAYIYPGEESAFPEYCFAFPKERILHLIEDIGYEYLDNVILETNSDLYLLRDDDTLDIFFSKDHMRVHIGRIEKKLDEDTMTMLIKVREPAYNAHVQSAVERYPELRLRFWSGKWTEISEIYFPTVNKAKALEKIADFYNIPRERIIAFGDASNDLELLKFAGTGVAMKNAENELKAAADRVTSYTNDEDGILHELKNIFSVK